MAKTRAGVPEIGQKAPGFELKAHTGENMRLDDFAGSCVVIYFYPKDDTPGCSIEAQEFRDALPEFKRRNAIVLGISPDSVESHCKFVDKFSLNFILLADPEHVAAEQYGAWVEKNNYGKKYWGVQRSTFLIGPDGNLLHAWPRVTPAGHAREVLDTLPT